MNIITANDEFKSLKTQSCIAITRKDCNNFAGITEMAGKNQATIPTDPSNGSDELRFLIKLPGRKKQRLVNCHELWQVLIELKNNSK